MSKAQTPKAPPEAVGCCEQMERLYCTIRQVAEGDGDFADDAREWLQVFHALRNEGVKLLAEVDGEPF